MLNILQTKEFFNTKVYVDFENIYTILKKSGHDPLEIGFFEVLRRKMEAEGMYINDFIVYANFEQAPLNKYQTVLRKMGFATRHSAIEGKNCGDLELAVDALRDLYTNQNLDIFVIITNDRDFTPLLKSISAENKISYVFSTKSSFNPVLLNFSAFHMYLEDLFNLGDLETPVTSVKTLTVNQDLIDPAVTDPLGAGAPTIDQDQIARAREVAFYFYRSKIWRKSSLDGKPITLKGYLDVIIRVLKRSADELLSDFRLAHSLKYLTIFQDQHKGECITQGEYAGLVYPWTLN